MIPIVRKGYEIKVSEIEGADVPAPLPQNIEILKGFESKKLFEKDGDKEFALFMAPIPSRPIVCITALGYPCNGNATYETSKTCGLNLIKKAECNGMIDGIPKLEGPVPNIVKCTVTGNTKKIFVVK